ncbi:MAG: UPF0280 family protein [bacterium]|nr:UPF0280 family protein [bacterium]
MYEARRYRNNLKCEGLIKFVVAIKETDLFIGADKKLVKEAKYSIKKNRKFIEEYILEDPIFHKTFKPCKASGNAPLIVKDMAWAGVKANVGPMAAVAGAIAEYVGKDLLKYSNEVIVENGGDIFISCIKKRKIGVFAGKSVLSEKIAIEVDPDDTPLGICTSSGTVSHSISFGRSDAVVVVSKSTALADAVATRIGNMISGEINIHKIKKYVENIKGVKGVLVIKDDKLGVFGDIKITKM